MFMPHEATHVKSIFSWISGNPVAGEAAPSEEVIQSWTRSICEHNLDPANHDQPKILSRHELKDYQEPLDRFLWIAKAGLGNLYQQLSALDYVVVLADANGVNIEFKADKIYAKELRKAGVYLGSVWSEENEGTNGAGVCIKTHKPIIIHKSDHFKTSHMHLTCSVAPIFDPSGKLLAVLDASGLNPQHSKESQFLVLQFVKQTAKLIEKAFFLEEFRHSYILKVFKQKEFAQVAPEALIAFNEEGTILAANKEAEMLLTRCVDETLLGRPIEAIFNVSLNDLLSHTPDQQNLIWPISLRSTAAQSYASLYHPEKRVSVEKTSREAPSPAFATEEKLDLEVLAGADPVLVHNVHCARRVLNKDIPILLLGETGTGKEAFARAIHNASNRADKAFVALNCASIPESLIESELFGYEEGAFTGAKKKGMQGKIIESNGGTLFLDEIGDMPVQLQTRLLRVLAEKEVVPLGGGCPIKIDLHFICATHRNLKELIRAGSFREDLYYRLNGVSLKLPPIRERADKISLIYSAFKAEAGSSFAKRQIGEDALDVLSGYDWPGNIRQLRSALRYALAINDSGVIGLNDLPLDILENKKELSTPVPTSAPAVKQIEQESEKSEILKVLQDNQWNKTLAAQKLGMGRATLYRKMQKYQIIQPNLR